MVTVTAPLMCHPWRSSRLPGASQAPPLPTPSWGSRRLQTPPGDLLDPSPGTFRPPRYDFSELVRNVGRLDSALLSGFVAHHESGVDVLQSPDVVDSASETAVDDAERAMLFLRGLYDYVIFDCQRSFSGTNLAVIDHADELYLIATPDVPAVRDLSRCVDRLIQCNLSPGKLKVALNRYSSQGAVTLPQIEKAIRQPISITVPNCSAELIRAMNTGTPLAPESKSEFVSQIRQWAASLVPGSSSPEPRAVSRTGWRIPFWSPLKATG